MLSLLAFEDCFLTQRAPFLYHTGGSKSFDNVLPPFASHGLCFHWVLDHGEEGTSKGGRGRITQKACPLVENGFRGSSGIDSYHGRFTIHGFQGNNAKVFVGGRIDHGQGFSEKLCPLGI